MEPARIKSLSLVVLLLLLIITGYAFVGQVFEIKQTEYDIKWGTLGSGRSLTLVSDANGFTCTSNGGAGLVTSTDGLIRLSVVEGASYSCSPASPSRTFFLSSPAYAPQTKNLGQNNLTFSAGLNSVSVFVVEGDSDDDDDDTNPTDPFKSVDTIGLSSSYGPQPSDSIYITIGTPTLYSGGSKSDVNGGVAGVSLTCLLLATGLIFYLLYLEYQAARYPETFATV